ncbi:MAG: hypothetical protein QM669_03035 [Siphonobacter sp.]
MNRTIFNTSLWVVLYLLLQVFFFRGMILFDSTFCFVYIACTLSMSFDTPKSQVLLMAFGTGFFVDLFYNTLGLHAASTVFLAFARPTILRILTPARGYEERTEPLISDMSLRWVISYVFLSALLHSTLLFTLESLNISLIIPLLVKIITSTLYTTFVIVTLQYFRGN